LNFTSLTPVHKIRELDTRNFGLPTESNYSGSLKKKFHDSSKLALKLSEFWYISYSRIAYSSILVHKFLHHKHLLPTAFANYLTTNIAVHLYNMRVPENLHLDSVSTNYGKRTV